MRLPPSALAVVALLACACTRPGSTSQPAPEQTQIRTDAPVTYETVVIKEVPHVRQRTDFCGEACAEMALRHLGRAVDQNRVFELTGLRPEQGRGAYTRELHRALESLGFKVGDVGFPIDAARAPEQLETHWAAIHADLLAGWPSIVCTRFDERPNTTEHFRLITGYDAKSDEVIYHDPAIDNGSYLRMKRSRLFGLWPLRYDPETWTLIRFRLEPGEAPSSAPTSAGARFTKADYAQHVMKLREKYPLDGFTIVVQPPFVVVGDEEPERVQRRARDTVKWTVDRLKEAYFTQDPNHILTIWLFRDRDSYQTHARTFLKDTPTTPYGYYSSSNRALVMNIATGGGTLVHEIVHPFVEANFPDCPSWLNEGLGSLYEQCGDEAGQIHGYTNWRLPGLQEAIRDGRVPPFETLFAMDSNAFYNGASGTHYAQARYLCYYLQDKGLLRKFYREFHTNRSTDPSGVASLRKVLGTNNLVAFQKSWETYVLGLRFR